MLNALMRVFVWGRFQAIALYLNTLVISAAKINIMAILSTNPASILHRKSFPSTGAMPTVDSDDDDSDAPEPAAPQAPTQADVDLLMSLQWITSPPA
jgi:hypothetical protein